MFKILFHVENKILVKPNTGQRITTNRSKAKIGYNLNSSQNLNLFNNTITNINKVSLGRSITPTNLSKRTSKDFLNRSLNMKNQQSNNRFGETNTSFSPSMNNLNKTGGFSKSPSAYKNIGNKPKTSIRVSKDISLDRNSNINKSFDKSKEGFNPKSTTRLSNDKSPMSSRSNIKKPNNNVRITTNASPIFKNNKNINVKNTSKSPIDNSIIKNFNDFKNKNASPVIYSSFIKKIQNNKNKKIPSPFNSTQNNINNHSPNNVSKNQIWGNNIPVKNPNKNSNISSNMNSNDISTNNTSGLNSNNNHNYNYGNHIQSNDGEYMYQIQPKYEEDGRSSLNKNNKINIQKNNNIPINIINLGLQQNNPLKNRENKFSNNNQDVNFKTMNTSPLLRVKNYIIKIFFKH